MRRFRSVFVLSLVCLFAACAAWASDGLGGTPYSLVALSDGRVVYSTSENYTSGAVGVIDPSSGAVEAGVRKNLGGDAVVFSFKRNGSDRVLIANRLSWGAQTELQVFDPSNWTSPEWNVTVDGNLHGVTAISDDIYFAYYGSGSGLGRIEKRSVSNYEVTASRDMFPVVSEDKAETILATDGGKLFLLAQGFEKYSVSPDRGALYKLNSDLSLVSSVDVGVNPVGLSARAESLYVASNGNYDSSRQEAWRVDGATMVTMKLNLSGFESQGEFVQALFDNGDKIFVVTSVFDAASSSNLNKIYLVDRPSSFGVETTLILGSPVTSMTGWTVGTAMDRNGRLWACSSNGPDGSVKGIGFNGSVETYTPTGNDHPQGSGGGGCSVGVSPSALLLFAPILLLFRCR